MNSRPLKPRLEALKYKSAAVSLRKLVEHKQKRVFLWSMKGKHGTHQRPFFFRLGSASSPGGAGDLGGQVCRVGSIPEGRGDMEGSEN